ncbi:hypothetical protein TSUD_346700 [Trifolium subterraneum]|nr:hypothetical protein TSUD_346700 [Trifolium subterraneum]
MNYLTPHPNILKIFDCFEDNYFSYIVLELCQTNDLSERIKQGGPLSEPLVACLVKNLLEAIEHCHENGVAHRDIKPENVLIDFNGNIKLGNFGFSEWFIKEGIKKSMIGVVGTPSYSAPEVVFGKECYNEKVDIWSCGVTLYVMLTGIMSFVGETNDEIVKKILKTDMRFPEEKSEYVSSSAIDLIRMMVCREPSFRISAKQALMHPWIVKGGMIKDYHVIDVFDLVPH